MQRLTLLGWSSFFERQIGTDDDHDRGAPARVIADHGQEWRLAHDDSDVNAVWLPEQGAEPTDRPTAGDWVIARPCGPRGRHLVARVLERRSALVRKVAGAVTAPQVLAANVDVVFVVMGLDGDANLRRLERWVAAIWESGAAPVVLLNKADVAANGDAWVRDAAEAAPGVAVHLVCALDGRGVDAITATLAGHRTGVLVGSSGAGKSTLLNRLLGEARQRTQAVIAGDHRGRHTTAARELFPLAGGGCLIDGPGIRELQLWDEGGGLDAVYADIAALAAQCRFRDCRHAGEPGCAVAEAIAGGRLDEGRLAGYHKLARELASLVARQSGLARLEEKRRWRTIHKSMRRMPPK